MSFERTLPEKYCMVTNGSFIVSHFIKFINMVSKNGQAIIRYTPAEIKASFQFIRFFIR